MEHGVLGYGLGLFQRLRLRFTLHVVGEEMDTVSPVSATDTELDKDTRQVVCNGQSVKLCLQVAPPVDWQGPMEQFVDHFYQNSTNISFAYKCYASSNSDSSTCVLLGDEAAIVFTHNEATASDGRDGGAADNGNGEDKGAADIDTHDDPRRSALPYASKTSTGIAIYLYTTINVPEQHFHTPLHVTCGLKYSVEAATFGGSSSVGHVAQQDNTGSATYKTPYDSVHHTDVLLQGHAAGGTAGAPGKGGSTSGGRYAVLGAGAAAVGNNRGSDGNASYMSTAAFSSFSEETSLRQLLEYNRYRPTRIPSREASLQLRVVNAIHVSSSAQEVGPAGTILLLCARNMHPYLSLQVHDVSLHTADSFRLPLHVPAPAPADVVHATPLSDHTVRSMESTNANAGIAGAGAGAGAGGAERLRLRQLQALREVHGAQLDIAELFHFLRLDVPPTSSLPYFSSSQSPINTSDSNVTGSGTSSSTRQRGMGAAVTVPVGGSYTFAYRITPKPNPEEAEHSPNSSSSSTGSDSRSDNGSRSGGGGGGGVWHPLLLGVYSTAFSLTWSCPPPATTTNAATGTANTTATSTTEGIGRGHEDSAKSNANIDRRAEKLDCYWSLGCDAASASHTANARVHALSGSHVVSTVSKLNGLAVGEVAGGVASAGSRGSAIADRDSGVAAPAPPAAPAPAAVASSSNASNEEEGGGSSGRGSGIGSASGSSSASTPSRGNTAGDPETSAAADLSATTPTPTPAPITETTAGSGISSNTGNTRSQFHSTGTSATPHAGSPDPRGLGAKQGPRSSAPRSSSRSPYKSPYGSTVASLTSRLESKLSPFSPYNYTSGLSSHAATTVGGGVRYGYGNGGGYTGATDAGGRRARGTPTPGSSSTSSSGRSRGNAALLSQHPVPVGEDHSAHGDCPSQSLFSISIAGPLYGILHELVELRVHITNTSTRSFSALQLRSSYAAPTLSASIDAAADGKGMGAGACGDAAYAGQAHGGSILMGNTICETAADLSASASGAAASASASASAAACLVSECRTQISGTLLPGDTATLTLHALPLQLGQLVLGALHLYDPQEVPAKSYTLLQRYSLLILDRDLEGGVEVQQ